MLLGVVIDRACNIGHEHGRADRPDPGTVEESQLKTWLEIFTNGLRWLRFRIDRALGFVPAVLSEGRWFAKTAQPTGPSPPPVAYQELEEERRSRRPSRFGRPPPRSRHGILDKLRVRALHELCDWLGLAFVPGRMWESLDEHGDPSEAVIHFARGVGCDPDAIRRRDHDALERLRTSVDLLFALDQLNRMADLGQKDEIEYSLFSSDSMP